MAMWDKAYMHDLDATSDDIVATHQRLRHSTDLAQAVSNVDLVIEAVPEVTAIKTSFYHDLAKVAPAKTIFATNTSTRLPSEFAAATGRPERFLALHFANHIWLNNIAEVMGHAGTSPEDYATVVAFAKRIGMIPITLKKEQSGYVLNSLLVPFLRAGASLWVHDIASPEVIDRSWMIATRSPMGPFAIFDLVGLRTAYNILSAQGKLPGNELSLQIADKLKRDLIDQGKLGQESGVGFYTYPNPAYKSTHFLTGDQVDVTAVVGS